MTPRSDPTIYVTDGDYGAAIESCVSAGITVPVRNMHGRVSVFDWARMHTELARIAERERERIYQKSRVACTRCGDDTGPWGRYDGKLYCESCLEMVVR